ncbi:MAG: aminotransferase class III-fold pyridoxal phosphate-dependent enzyme, partial [bacterium]
MDIYPKSFSMSLIRLDLDHLIHPVHSAADQAAPVVFTEGKGAVLRDIDGKEYLDGLACLWNVHVGHGRRELAEAAAAQMRRLAYASAYSGFTNEPAVRLADRLLGLAYP